MMPARLLIAVIFLLVATAACYGQTCAITSPTNGQMIQAAQPIQLTATVTSAPSAYKLVWFVDYQRWANGYVRDMHPTMTDFLHVWQGPWTVTWYTGLNGDGTHTVAGILYDIFGNQLASCPAASFVVNAAGMSNQSINYFPNYPFISTFGTTRAPSAGTVNPLSSGVTPTMLIVGLAWYGGGSCATPPGLADSSGNTYTVAVKSPNSHTCVGIFYVRNPTVSTSMYWTTSGGGYYQSFVAIAVTGTATSGGADVTGSNVSTSPVTTLGVATTSITPNHNNEVCFTVFGDDSAEGGIPPGALVSSPFALQNWNGYVSAAHEGVFLGYQIQGTATAVLPSYSWTTPINYSAAVIACFQ